MSNKPRVRFLTVIWGERYIEEFSRVSLLSFLAPGNLPALAQASDLEVLILTSESSPEIFRKEPAFRALEAICPVKFIFIDDLITTGVYGVTLTLAYARGIRDSGAEQTETCFVFMNSDFVLADGSLKTLVAKVAEGHRCIMAPSLRACSEAVMPLLADSIDRAAGYLALPPRELVQLAFDNLHPTVIGKTITQDFMKCATHNQIYWQVDSTTLLGRYHLIFMLAIKPERPMPPVNSYCDYGFVPELVPSGQFTVLGDSDDFFMLELQSAGQEKQYLRGGRSRIGELAKELSIWTTREHRRFAEVDVVFHAVDLPPTLQTVRDQAAALMARLRRKMKRKPVNHVRHFYWVFGVEAWLTRRRADMDADGELPLPPECGPLYARRDLLKLGSLRTAYLMTLGRLRRLAGVKPYVPIWHHGWSDSRLVLNWIAALNVGPNQRNLLVSTSSRQLARSLGRAGAFDVILVRDLMDDDRFAAWQREQGGKAHYRNILCHIHRSHLRQTRSVLERLTDLFHDESTVAVYIDHEEGESHFGDFSVDLAQHVHDVFPAGWTGLQISTRFVGGALRWRLFLLESRLRRHLWPRTWQSVLLFPVALLLWPFVAGLTAVNNWLSRNGTESCPPFCSSVLLRLSIGRADVPDVTAAMAKLVSVGAMVRPVLHR